MKCTRCGGSGYEIDHVAIGAEYRERRREKGLTLADMGLRTGYSVAFLSDLERGRRSWNNRNLNKYWEGLHA